MSPSFPPSVEEALATLVQNHALKPGDPILRGKRFTIAYGGSMPGGQAYLLLDQGHIIQRRELISDPNQRRSVVGGYVGGIHIQHRLMADPEGGLKAEVEDASTRAVENLEPCVSWPGNPRVARKRA